MPKQTDPMTQWTRRRLMGAVAAGAVAYAAPAAAAQAPRRAQPGASAKEVAGRTLPRTVLYYGTEEPLPRSLDLRAGPLTVVFEPALAFLRYVRLGETEVLRGLYAAVRDRNWGTVPPHVRNLKVETTGDSFRITFDVECKEGPIDFLWKGALEGGSDGTISFDFDGTARSTFLRNRIGFCVLHPEHGCAGRPCTVEKVDGAVERGRFPDDISPHQPFINMRAISHEVAPGVRAEVRMEGDTFEMEDQRNWTDGSYKTYCTPLGLPFPVEVKSGSKVRQKVTLRLEGSTGQAIPAARAAASEIAFTPVAGAAAVRMPRIGAGISSDVAGLRPVEVARLRAAGLAHLRVDVDVTRPDAQRALERGCEQARMLGVPLELALTMNPDGAEELSALVAGLRRLRPQVARYLVFARNEKSTTAGPMRLARQQISAYDAGAKLASGTNAYFTELNRGRPPVADSDVICYSINPQVHAFDNVSLVETLEVQATTLRSARKFSGSLPLLVTPVTLRPRFNPNATEAPSDSGPSDALPFEVDERQMSLFGAAWTLGSLKYLAEGGADSVTFYETVGWRGMMESQEGARLPGKFRSIPGDVFPLYHVIADVAEFTGGDVAPYRSSANLSVDGLMLRGRNRRRVLLANLSPEPKLVRVASAELGPFVRVKHLDEHTAVQAMESPEAWRRDPGLLMQNSPAGLQLALLPFAVARIDPSAR